jgi:hypothetical protein
MALLMTFIGYSLTALIGGISYTYFIEDDKVLDLKESNETIHYSLVDEKLNETCVSSKNSPTLGITFQDKCKNLIILCNEYSICSLHYDNSKKGRHRFLKYIREYEKIGLDGFIDNHKKKLKDKNI